ncbi:MAG TPA: PEGA domain-containing protein [Polyangiaceae bacterium]|nr:PEGA domain-containing protein [Polyangiaceae bacterium]
MILQARWMARGALLLSGAWCVQLSAAPAAAQSATARAESPEVEKLITEAIALREQGKDFEALEALKQASELDPRSVRVQVHLSNVHQALGQWLPADQYLRMALAQPDHPYVQRHRQELEDARGVIEDNIGSLGVEGEPAGAEVKLNGRLIGTLPLSAPVPVTVGSYTLEVKMVGHYPVRRPIAISGRGFVREFVQLQRLPGDELGTRSFPAGVGPASAGTGASAGEPLDSSSTRPWLTWTLAGLGAAAGLTTVGAIVYREQHAQRWNDDSCLALGQTREQLCGEERDKVETADAIAITSGVAAGLFAAGAILNAYVFTEPSGASQTGLQGCALGPAGASCFGAF